MIPTSFSRSVTVFHGRTAPEPGTLVGYGALIEALQLAVPLPRDVALISTKRRQYHVTGWRVFTPRHQPADTLWAHLVFALKYEGLDLLFFKKLFVQLPAATLEEWVRHAPQSRYARTVWFLYEWLLAQRLDLPDLTQGNYVPVVNEQLQYAAATGVPISRQRLRNNLPGVAGFCPLVHKTATLEQYLARDLGGRAQHVLRGLHADVLVRTSAFLLLKDSKASFTIEGEQPPPTRALRWGRAIGQAGQQPLSREELLRLQQLVIENSRFVRLGYRTEGGFVGEHDRQTGTRFRTTSPPAGRTWRASWARCSTPRPTWKPRASPVLSAAAIAFGFVFIHPFVDGNGRVHRYLIHHLLARLGFTPPASSFRSRPRFSSTCPRTGRCSRAIRTPYWSSFPGGRPPTTTWRYWRTRATTTATLTPRPRPNSCLRAWRIPWKRPFPRKWPTCSATMR
ncbi:Fic family protein [Hymenobacter humi]|uniref:Fic family protein n=1 Tax=Hymenobacter humi TaxID=1411620 RepID=A0ABW2U5D8_9BACT